MVVMYEVGVDRRSQCPRIFWLAIFCSVMRSGDSLGLGEHMLVNLGADLATQSSISKGNVGVRRGSHV